MLEEKTIYVDELGKKYAEQDFEKAVKWDKRICCFKRILNSCYFYQFQDPATDISPDIDLPLIDKVKFLTKAEICYIDKLYAKEKYFKTWNKVVKRYKLDLPILGNADLRYVKDFLTNESTVVEWYGEN